MMATRHGRPTARGTRQTDRTQTGRTVSFRTVARVASRMIAGSAAIAGNDAPRQNSASGAAEAPAPPNKVTDGCGTAMPVAREAKPSVIETMIGLQINPSDLLGRWHASCPFWSGSKFHKRCRQWQQHTGMECDNRQIWATPGAPKKAATSGVPRKQRRHRSHSAQGRGSSASESAEDKRLQVICRCEHEDETAEANHGIPHGPKCMAFGDGKLEQQSRQRQPVCETIQGDEPVGAKDL